MSLNNFEMGNQLGQGAFGTVVVVKRKEDNKNYAMKRVKIAQLSQKERENALNEIRLLGSLSHDNIIGYKEAFFDDNTKTLNIVMELADDGDITSKIQQNSKKKLAFKESSIWSILIQILKGLKYLHDNKIMHRDLKSANVFLMKSGTVKIGDMNVSKFAQMGMAKTQIGTPYYASPEIWNDAPYDYKCDIWSIGCIVYEMCTFKPPFRGTSLISLHQNIKKGVYDPIPKIYSSELRKIISFMLQVNPSERKSCEELLKSDILIEKMKETQTFYTNDNDSNQFELIKTIKIPKNMKEINSALPQKRYKKHNRENMMANDEYETKKNGFYNNNIKDDKEKGKAIEQNQQKPIVIGNNNYDRFLRQKKEVNSGKSSKKDSSSSQNEEQKIKRVNDYLEDQLKKKSSSSNNSNPNQRPVSGVNRKPIALQQKVGVISNNNNKINLNNNNPLRPNSGYRPSSGSNRKVSPKNSPHQIIKSSGYNKNPNNVLQSKNKVQKKVILQKIDYNKYKNEHKKVEHPYYQMNKNKPAQKKLPVIIKRK